MTTRETLKALYERGDLLPWLNGETDVIYCGKPLSNPRFDDHPNDYNFRPIPKPPVRVLRPWTWDELWEHRDCWFRMNDKDVCQRINGADHNDQTVCLDEEWIKADAVRDGGWEYFLISGGEWMPCGTWTTEGGES